MLALLLAYPLIAWTPQAPAPTVTPFKASGIYDLGERAGWTVTNPSGGKVAYTLKRNNQEVIRKGELDLTSGSAVIEERAKEPAMLFLEVAVTEGKPRAFGAAIAPTKLRPVAPRPKNFDAFWDAKIKALRAIPENDAIYPGESDRPGVLYAKFQMDHVNGTHVYGQMAKPDKPGKYPAMLILQWASPPYPLQKSWVTDAAAKGWLAVNIQPHDVEATAPASYYRDLPTEVKNYALNGQADRDRSAFVEMYLRGVRAADFITGGSWWDGKTFVVMGTSMGGQQSFAVAGLHPKVSHLIVNVPAGCDLNASLHGRQMGYPFFHTTSPKVMETARYIDAINFAPRIKATSLVAMGFVDDISPPAGIWTAFNLIRGKKEAAPMVDSPHNNYATAEQQRPYTARASEWLNALVRGEKIPAKRL